MLGIGKKEDIISNLLCYCFNNLKTFRKHFFIKICDYSHKDLREIQKYEARTRISTRKGVPDIVILIQSNSKNEIIVIENKLLADEGWEQTKRYATTECKEDLKEKFNITNSEFRFIYLTLFPDNTTNNSEFTTKHYDVLFQDFDILNFEDEVAGRILKDLGLVFSDFYNSSLITDNDIVIEKLQKYDELDSAYLYFKSFFSCLDLPFDLKLKYTFNSTQKGRHYFGAQFSKTKWEPDRYDEKSLTMNKNTYSIHFEPQFNVLAGSLNFYIHYEPNPYKPVKQIENYNGYEEYLHQRSCFIKLFHSNFKSTSGFKAYNGSNQIGKFIIDFKDKNYKLLKIEIEEIVRICSSVVECTLK